jgi:hypothetical protein
VLPLVVDAGAGASYSQMNAQLISSMLEYRQTLYSELETIKNENYFKNLAK